VSAKEAQNHTVVTTESEDWTEEDPMHPMLAEALARQAVDDRRRWAGRQRLASGRWRESQAAWRVTVGSRLIAIGCRLFLSGYATSTVSDGSQAARSARRLSLENTSTMG
jgi:hypothetical protein